jgi:hypothetical protein
LVLRNDDDFSPCTKHEAQSSTLSPLWGELLEEKAPIEQSEIHLAHDYFSPTIPSQ